MISGQSQVSLFSKEYNSLIIDLENGSKLIIENYFDGDSNSKGAGFIETIKFRNDNFEFIRISDSQNKLKKFSESLINPIEHIKYLYTLVKACILKLNKMF